MRVRTGVLEEVIDQIRAGMPARIRLKAFPELVFKGTVREIALLARRELLLRQRSQVLRRPSSRSMGVRPGLGPG